MQSMSLFAVLLVLVAASCAAFSPQHVTATAAAKTSTSTSTTSSTTALSMANDNDLLRWARSARTAGVDDRVVELRRPLGVVLSEDASGNVYVETVAARGNAARTGEVSSICCMLEYMQSKEKSLELEVKDGHADFECGKDAYARREQQESYHAGTLCVAGMPRCYFFRSGLPY